MGVAQLDRAFGYGPKGRGFESSRPRLKALQREVLFLYNRKLHFLLYKKPLAGCALRRTMMMSQATPAGARMCQGTFFVLFHQKHHRWILRRYFLRVINEQIQWKRTLIIV